MYGDDPVADNAESFEIYKILTGADFAVRNLQLRMLYRGPAQWAGSTDRGVWNELSKTRITSNLIVRFWIQLFSVSQ